MKVLMISSDRSIFIKDAEAHKRIREYGKLFDQLHVIVFADYRLGAHDQQLAENVFIYPTNHRLKWLYLWDVLKIIRRIIGPVSSVVTDFVITAQDPFEAGLAAWLAKLEFHLPLQLQVHTDVMSPYFAKESLLNRLRVTLAQFLLPRADGIRVVSERIKRSLSQADPRLSVKIEVLPIFVDVKKIQSAKIKTDLHKKYPDFDFIILMASRLTKEKNIRMAINAMRGVVVKYPKALLLIVGDGPELNNCKLLAERYALKQNVFFEPAIDPQMLFSYYKTADLFLLSSNYEGYGRTVIEAMAAGVSVIMTDVGLAGELLVDELDGMVVSVGDMDALCDDLQSIMEHPDRRAEFVKESMKVIASLSEKKDYLVSYKRLLESLR